MIAGWKLHRARGSLAARIALFTLVLHLVAAPLAFARQATPAGTPIPEPRPARPTCAARPASATGLISVLVRPVPEDPDADDPRGDALPPAERAPLGDLVGQWRTCLASGNVRGLLGLFTADGVRRLLGERSPYVGGPSGMNVAILAVGDVVRMRDGRIAATVSVDPSGRGAAAPEFLQMIVEQGDDGVWRIDLLHSPDGPVGAAGPAPSSPGTAAQPLLRHPISPGPNVAIQAPGPDVPMRGSDAARSGSQPGPLPAGEPVATWRAPTGWISDAQPIVARGLISFGGFSLGGRLPLLEALDVATGGVRWQTTAPVAWAEFSDAPALAGDMLFAPVQAPVAGLLAVAAGTGQAIWFAPFGFMSLTAPAASTDAVYVAGWGLVNARDSASHDISGAVIALDQRTGRERWRFLASARFGPVAVGRQSVFVPSYKGLFALDRTTGHKRWQTRFSPGPDQTPVVSSDVVAFSGTEITSGKPGIFALDVESGALRWRVDLPAVAGTGGAAATADTLFVTWWEASDDVRGAPTLRAYDLASGAERWVFRANPANAAEGNGSAGAITTPVIVGGSILFGVSASAAAQGVESEMNGLYAVDGQTGALQWHVASNQPISSAPAALNGQIFAMSGGPPHGGGAAGNLLAFGAE